MMAESGIRVGDRLKPVCKEVRQKKINQYARASNDPNPIHIDPAFAEKTFLGGTIAQGLLIVSYATEMLREFFGEPWLKGGELEIAFVAPTRPGEKITADGVIREISARETGMDVKVDVWCENERGQKKLVGNAEGFMPLDPGQK